MTWSVSVRYESDKFPDTPVSRMSISHAIDPVEAVKTSLDRINQDRNGKHFKILSFSVVRQ